LGVREYKQSQGLGLGLTLNGVPLHRVLAGDLAKVALDNVGDGRLAEVVVINLGAEVELALGLELVVQAAGAAAATSVGRLGLGSGGGRAATATTAAAAAAAASARDALRVVFAVWEESRLVPPQVHMKEHSLPGGSVHGILTCWRHRSRQTRR